MDAKLINSVTIGTAAFVEVRFAGNIAERLGKKGLRDASVTIRFKPGTGKATTITESGPTDEPTTRRRGSRGFSATVREGRRLFVLVKSLPAPAAKVFVRTSDPPKKKLDTLRDEQVPFLDEEAELDIGIQLTDSALGGAIDLITKLQLDAADTSARIKELKRTLKRARNARKIRRARKALKRQTAKLARLQAREQTVTARRDLFERWLKSLEAELRGPATRQCSDGLDNDNDSLTDFGFDKDPGCVMRLDNDEVDAPMPLTCPNPGQSRSVSGTIYVAQGNTLERFIISLPPKEPDEPRLAIVDAPVTAGSGGPYPLETGITQLCNYEFDFVYSYSVFTNNTPPGAYGLRVTVSVENNGGYPGGGQLSMLLAAGTTR